LYAHFFRLDVAAFEEAKHRLLVDYLVIDINLKAILNNAISDLIHHRRIISMADELCGYESLECADLAQLDPYLIQENMFTYIEHK